jgi:hypothetical protein
MPRKPSTDVSTMINDPVWSAVLIRYLRMERSKQNFTFANLSQALEEKVGIVQTADNLKTKFNRGNFGAQLLLMCLYVMGSKQINMADIVELYEQIKAEQRR